MHEHVRCMIMHVWMFWNAWWLAICRHNFAEIDETLECWARNGSRSDTYLQKFLFWGCRHSKIRRDRRWRQEAVKQFEWYCCLLEQSRKCFWHRICGQCFCMFVVFFFFHFSSSHFCLDRPFGFSIHRGIVFSCPCFLPELPLKVVNPSGCSFLPKPPFRVFDLSSIFLFFIHAFHSVFSFLPLTTDRSWEEGLLATWIGIDINVDLFMHVHLNVPSCSGLFSKYLKNFQFLECLFRTHHY